MDVEMVIKIKAIVLFVIAFLNFLLAFLIWYRGKTKATLHLGIMAFFSAVFALTIGGIYFFWETSPEMKLFSTKATWMGVLMLPAFITFVYYFVQKTKYLKIKSFLLYLTGVIITILALTTPLFVKNADFYIKNTFLAGEQSGFLDPIGRIYILFCLIVILVDLLKYYFKNTGLKKLQIKYFIFGTTIYATGGLISTALFPLLLKETVAYVEIAAYLSFFWVGLTTYTIFRKQLFEIKIILTEILVGVMLTILITLPFLVKTLQLRILTIIIFFLFCFIGYLLIRSVYGEFKQKDVLEKLNEDLKKTYEQEKKDKLKIKRMGEKLLETERKIKEDAIEAAGQTERRFSDYFIREENLDKLKLKQEILMLAGKVKELEKELEKAQRGRKRKRIQQKSKLGYNRA